MTIVKTKCFIILSGITSSNLNVEVELTWLEYFIEFKDIFLPHLYIIFNLSNTPPPPTQWSNAIIAPVFKKGDPN